MALNLSRSQRTSNGTTQNLNFCSVVNTTSTINGESHPSKQVRHNRKHRPTIWAYIFVHFMSILNGVHIQCCSCTTLVGRGFPVTSSLFHYFPYILCYLFISFRHTLIPKHILPIHIHRNYIIEFAYSFETTRLNHTGTNLATITWHW